MNELNLTAIRRDGGTQPRSEIKEETVNEYRLDMMAGAAFPPVVVFYDGTDYWLADGFHRVLAALQLGRKEIAADVRQGSRRDAVLHSVGANAAHGLRRTNEDKRRAVLTLLSDDEWGKWSDREIARRAGVDHRFVGSVRSSLGTVPSEERTYTTKHGTVSTMNTANIGGNGYQQQEEIVQAGREEILTAAKSIISQRRESVTAVMDERRKELAETPLPAPGTKYSTIVIDPPWPMQKISRILAPDQVGFDYPTMTIDEIKGLPVVNESAAGDCHLFLWTTQKYLPASFDILAAWGFRYIFTMVWHKPGGFQPFGLPQYNCEFVLYGRRGSPDFLETKAFPTAFKADRNGHSVKPPEFYEMIERVCPAPRIEIFSRGSRPGFDGWGDES